MRTHDTASVVLTSAATEGWLRADQINVDMQYQRPLNMGHVRAIAGNFDPNAFGVLLVSERADGTYWVIDGQHRLAAIRLRDDDNPIPCHIYRGLSIEDEATVFHMQTKRRAISPIDRFRARLFAGDPQALEIDRITRKYGWQIGVAQRGNLSAAGAIETVYIRNGERRLDLILDILKTALSDDPDQMPSSVMIVGLNAFLTRYEAIANRRRIADTIRAAGITKINRNASALKELTGQNAGNAFGQALAAMYNHKLTTNRLPAWNEIGNATNVAHKTRTLRRLHAEEASPSDNDASVSEIA